MFEELRYRLRLANRTKVINATTGQVILSHYFLTLLTKGRRSDSAGKIHNFTSSLKERTNKYTTHEYKYNTKSVLEKRFEIAY